MPRKKKRKQVNIKSTETKIFFGLLLFVLGLALLLSPFVPTEATIFVQVTRYLGWPAIIWGISTLFIAFNLLTKGKRFNNWAQFTGIAMLAITLNTLFSFWIPRDTLENVENLNKAGGIVGRNIHLIVNNSTGDLIELFIILIFLVVAFSLITGVKLEQITDLFEQMFKNVRFNLPEKGLNRSEDDKDLVINGYQNEDNAKSVQDQQEIQFTEPPKDDFDASGFETPNISVPTSIPSSTTSQSENMEPSEPKYTDWKFPTIENLQEPESKKQDPQIYRDQAKAIESSLRSFGIQAKVVQISIGPTVVQYALSLAVGVKVAKIKNLTNDLALALSSKTSSVRIEAPIPGTPLVGIEIPNPAPNYVYLKEMAKKLIAEKDKYELPLILGKDITGQTVIKDLAKIPHVLVAGATGTGKSVGINSILAGLLLTKTPDEVKFIMVDPKMGVEMASYNGIPHLLNPVITDMELVVNGLQWCIDEMGRRYRQLKQVRAKKITEYNQRMGYTAMPYIVIVIDEMADLMLIAGPDVESKIQRLAQMGRAVGVHLILATQRPTVNVITGLIKANVPGRIAYAVAAALDSRVILDQMGAENLLGQGDMLFKDQTMPKSVRIQGAFTTTEDTEEIIEQIKAQIGEEDVEYSEELTNAIEKTPGMSGGSSSTQREPEFPQALQIVIAEGKASASFLQRRLRIGYNKAARLMEELEEAGAIGPQDGSKPRDVLVSSASQILGNDSEENSTQEF